MIRKDINQQDLLNAVVKYEKEVRLADFVGETEVKNIYRFKAQRREKLVVVLYGGRLHIKQEELLNEASRLIFNDDTLSDNLDFYTTNIITEKLAVELELPLRQQGLSVAFFDGAKIEKTTQFENLLEETVAADTVGEIDPAFFDYLAMSNDSSDIKNGFFYSILLMEVYRHQPVNEEEFYNICQNKYGRQQSDIKIALRNLRRKNKITPLKKGGIFSLTVDEERNLQNAIRESKLEEANFKEGLEQLLLGASGKVRSWRPHTRDEEIFKEHNDREQAKWKKQHSSKIGTVLTFYV